MKSDILGWHLEALLDILYISKIEVPILATDYMENLNEIVEQIMGERKY